MSKIHSLASVCKQRRRLSRDRSLWSDERGVTAMVVGLLAALVIGIVGLGIDVVGWYRTSREMQNAADSAAIAAATNGTATYQNEAKAVAAQYGYVDDTNGVHVTALNNQTCPNTAKEANCVNVTVKMDTAPQFFSQVVGLSAPPLTSAAMASGAQVHQYCLLALAGDGTNPAIRANGSNNANMTGCSVMSNTGSTCNGHNLLATYGDAHGTNTGCGVDEHSNVPQVSDPYSGLASNIPSNPCSSYSVEPSHTHDPPLLASNKWSGPITVGYPPTIANNGVICGDLQLTGNVTLMTASPGSVLLIENGRLDTNSYVLSTASTNTPGTGPSALTVIFSGANSSSYYHYPVDNSGGNGTDCSAHCLNFMAPASGPWKGVALYQDPSLTQNVSFPDYTGNNPTWDITGLAYFPHANVGFKGAVNKSTNGASCFVLVVDAVTIDGTADIEETGGCAAAGLAMPQDTVQGASLVQ
jgi:Flp pilus assembly protein TadG